MKTGKEIWKQKFAEFKEGYNRHHRAARRQRRADLGNGRRRPHDARLPRRLGSGNRQAAVAPLHHTRAGRARLRDLAARTCLTPGSTAAARPGRTARTIRELDLVYWGTGNAEPYNPKYRGGADSLYTASVLAIRPKTGEMVWHYQYIAERRATTSTAPPSNVLADLRVDGQMRKVLINANKNGFLYVIDRTNGKLIAAHPFVKVNWATHIDLQDRPAGADRRLRSRAQGRGRSRSGRRAAPMRRCSRSIRRPGWSTSTPGKSRAS